MFVVFGSWNLPVPFSFFPWLRASLLRLDDPLHFTLPLLHHLLSLFSVVARCVPDLTGEFLLELLPCLSFESRLSFEEPPRFLFHVLETLFIFHVCFPVVSTSPQLFMLLTCELLPVSRQSGMLLLGLAWLIVVVFHGILPRDQISFCLLEEAGLRTTGVASFRLGV